MIYRNLRTFRNIENIFLCRYIHSAQYFFCNKNESSDLKKHKANIMAKGLPKIKPIKDVNHIILIASGKGGVGKSTTAVNLAVSMKLAYPNKNIGLLDADIFGPSIPLMMNLDESPLVDDNKLMIPLNNYGVKCMSMGFLIEKGSPVIWRGLMVMQALEKLTRGVSWGPIDYLIIDTPPGTGDTHLSLIQNLPIDGVLLVTTPQNAALQVTKRGAVMFQKLKVPIIGLVENMSSIDCPNCSNNIKLFGSKTDELAKEIDISILSRFPLETEITDCCEIGVPIVLKHPEHTQSIIYKLLANSVINFVKNKM